MRTKDWLKDAEMILADNGIKTARLDALIMLEYVSNHDRAWLLANPNSLINAEEITKLRNLLNKRKAHTPISYLLGKAEFYGREFVLNEWVLEPRPESETMIDGLKSLVQDFKNETTDGLIDPENLHIADVGTGSGALGITAALELPGAIVELIDIDENALKTAKMNVDLFTLNLCLTQSDLLENARAEQDILLCNLPYVPDDFKINLAATHEPRIAIFGGKDGLDVYRRLFKQLKNRKNRPLYILCESLPCQHDALKQIAQDSSYDLENTDDFIQLFKRNG